MKKLLVVGLILVVTLLGVGFAAPVLAHSPDDGETATSSGIYLDQPTLTRVAQALGLAQEELLTHLKAGESIAEIAADQNVPGDEVVEAIVAPYRDELQLQVKYGYITQEQADALLEQARDHARDLLDEDLSSTEEYGSYSWEEMADDCNELMGNGGGSQSDWGGMGGGMMGGSWGGHMGGGMMGSYGNRSQNGWSGMMSGWGDSISRGWNNMIGSLGGMMGGGMM
jgi:hypothetical protein